MSKQTKEDEVLPNRYYDDEDELCNTHSEVRGSYYRSHYGQCIYCILDGKEWDEEWDSWDEVAIRAVQLHKMGFEDYKRGVVYPCKPMGNDPQGRANPQADFVRIYKDGQLLARSGNE